ncbi:MAG: ATP-binding protein [Anaerolineales bacterium]
MLRFWFKRFSSKVFVTYLILFFVVFLILGVGLELALPDALGRHMQGMGGMGGMQMGPGPNADLITNLRPAVNEALLLAAGAALLVALGLSAWLSRQLAAPLNEISEASQELAAGRYEKRVRIHGESDQNIDELGSLAQNFNHMAAELEHNEILRRQLIGDVSHELRTPLTAIKGYTEGLMDGVLPANAETYQHIHREADRLQRLVADLQELGQVEAGGFGLMKQPVTVADLAYSVQKRLGMQFEKKGVKLVVDLPKSIPQVLGDEDRLGQILLNLMGNALQYTPSGGEVKLSATPKDAAVTFKVADTGLGIPAEHLPHIFARFYRVDKSRSRAGGGSGVGLTIAKHLVEAHGGRIWAESPGPGKGSTFSFSIPLAL